MEHFLIFVVNLTCWPPLRILTALAPLPLCHTPTTSGARGISAHYLVAVIEDVKLKRREGLADLEKAVQKRRQEALWYSDTSNSVK